MLHIALTLLSFGLQDQGEWSKLDADIAALVKQPQQSTVVVYAVNDLLDPTAVDFEPPKLGMSTEPPKRVAAAAVVGTHAGDPKPEPTREDWMRATDTLAAMIVRHVQPALDPAQKPTNTGPGSIAFNGTVEQHAWITDFLRAQRLFQGTIVVETQIFTLPVEELAHLQIQDTKLVSRTTLASPRERDDFVARLKREVDVEQLSAPMLQIYPRQRANIAVIDQLSYVKDWTVDVVEPGAQEIADPEIGVINQGLVVDVRAMPVQGNAILAELAISHCTVKKPIETAKVRIGKAQSFEVEVALPAADTQTIQGDVVFADGASVVFVQPKLTDQRALLALVSVRRAQK